MWQLTGMRRNSPWKIWNGSQGREMRPETKLASYYRGPCKPNWKDQGTAWWASQFERIGWIGRVQYWRKRDWGENSLENPFPPCFHLWGTERAAGACPWMLVVLCDRHILSQNNTTEGRTNTHSLSITRCAPSVVRYFVWYTLCKARS